MQSQERTFQVRCRLHDRHPGERCLICNLGARPQETHKFKFVILGAGTEEEGAGEEDHDDGLAWGGGGVGAVPAAAVAPDTTYHAMSRRHTVRQSQFSQMS